MHSAIIVLGYADTWIILSDLIIGLVVYRVVCFGLLGIWYSTVMSIVIGYTFGRTVLLNLSWITILLFFSLKTLQYYQYRYWLQYVKKLRTEKRSITDNFEDLFCGHVGHKWRCFDKVQKEVPKTSHDRNSINSMSLQPVWIYRGTR